MEIVGWVQSQNFWIKGLLTLIFTLVWVFAVAVIWLPQLPALTTGYKEPVAGMPSMPQKASGPLSFEHFWGTTTGKRANLIHLSGLQIRGKNVSSKELHLKDAFLISGVTGAKRSMMIDVGSDGWIIPSEANPLPPNAAITLRAEFDPPDGLSAREFMDQWGSIDFVVQCEGSEYRDTFKREEIAAIFAAFGEYPDGPRPTKK